MGIASLDVRQIDFSISRDGYRLTAVARSVLGTGLVGGVLGHTTVLVHLDEVEGAIQATGEVGNVNVKGEFLVEKIEHLVVRVVRHEVCTRTNVLAGALSNKVKLECVAAAGDTVGPCVVSTVEGAVGSAGGVVGAKSRVPGVASVAVGVA